MMCEYCFYCDEAKKRTQHVYGMMNEKTLETIIEKTISEADAVASFTWQGGEPTLRGMDFFEKAVALQKKYKQQYKRNNLHIMNSFQTNGYELDRQWAKFFKRNQFLVGLSIDGFPEIHDLLRRGKDGSKSFFRVKQAADLLDQYQVDYNILTVVQKPVAERASCLAEKRRSLAPVPNLTHEFQIAPAPAVYCQVLSARWDFGVTCLFAGSSSPGQWAEAPAIPF